MKKIDFKRQFFIKDLFIPERVINCFNCIEFESYQIFSYCIENDLFIIPENGFIFIPIKSISDYKSMVKIFNETNICNNSYLYLIIEEQSLLDAVLSTIVDKRFSILITKDLKIDFVKYWNNTIGKEWISKNRIIKKIKIDYPNYDRQINEMISIFNEEFIRFFLLDFDYVSFEKIKIEEIHKLKFWIRNFIGWTKLKDVDSIEIISTPFVRKIFVSDELVLYMDNKKKDIWSFDLMLYLKDDGESMPMRELNLLRKYIDFVPNAMYTESKITNWFLMDYAQCKEIQGSLNEIPLMMGLINRWLYDF